MVLPSRGGLLTSREYKKYVKEELFRKPRNLFEKACGVSKIFTIRCPKFLVEKLEKPILMSGLDATPDQVFTLAVFAVVISSLAAIFLSFLIGPPTSYLLFFLPFFLLYVILTYPDFYADVIRVKAGNETVKVILYMAIYLCLNPLFDRAVVYAALNCSGPLGLDLRKIVWDVHIGKFPDIRYSLGQYVRKWNLWNKDFITALTTLQTIEVKTSPQAILETIQKSLDQILSGTTKQMSAYAKGLRKPTLLLQSMGIILPLLGLIMFPLVSIFLTDTINPLFIGVGYTIILPLVIWWFMYRIISKRPSAFSHSSVEGVKPWKRYPLFGGRIKLPILLVSILVGFLITIPGILHFTEIYSHYAYIHNNFPPLEAKFKWKDYLSEQYKRDQMIRNMFSGFTAVWGMGIGVVMYTLLRSWEPKKLEDFIREIEEGFEIGLFEIGGALEEGIPIEVAIPKIMEKYRRMELTEKPMYTFFRKLFRNIESFGMTFRNALFDPEEGVLKDFPSIIIRDVMNFLAGALQKGPKITALAAENIADYLRRIRKIEEMIKDILEEVISTLKMQASLIAPFICAVVASMSVLVIQLLHSISLALERLEAMLNLDATLIGSATRGASSTLALIKIEEIIPPTVLQLIAGIYMIEIVIIISVFLNGIDKGFDEVSRDVLIGKSLISALILYTIVAFLMVFFFQPFIAQIGFV